jgi:2-C-methyl-D-erythritol 4-phosphate cytidylyltransferase
MGHRIISAIVPAAGVGRRMQAERPKQYLLIHGKTVLEHTVEKLLSHPEIAQVVIAVSPDDSYFERLSLARHPDVIRVAGGQERSDSVLNALDYLVNNISPDWVMVHDAARPCVRLRDIDKLIGTVIPNHIGGILATPVRDTMKRSDGEYNIECTVEREALWHALTPQLFRTLPLYRALSRATELRVSVTDEASVMEWQGERPCLIVGCADNIKITQPEDLALAEFYLSRHKE